MNQEAPEVGGGRIAAILLATFAGVALLPNPGVFTNADSAKWALLGLGTLIALVFAFLRAVRSKDEITVLLPEHLVIVIMAVAAALLIGKRAPDSRATIRALAAIGTMAVFGILATGYLPDGRQVRRVVLATLAVTGIAAVLMVFEAVAGTAGAPSATFGNPSFAAEYAAGALPLALFFFLSGRRGLAALLFVACAVILGLAKSRADFLGAAAGATIAACLAWAPRRVRRVPPWVLALLLIGVVVALPPVIRALSLPTFGRSDTIEIRDHIRESTFRMAADHPVTGVGLEGFRAIYPKYRAPQEARLSLRREVTFPHNLPLSVAAEAGMVGLAVLLIFLFVPLYSGIRTSFERRQDAFAPAATGALAAILVSAQFSAPLRHPGSALLFFMLSALLVARRPRRFVTKLVGRYRRTVPIVVLLLPVGAGVVYGPHLVADYELARAKDATEPGRVDPAVADRLRSSIRAEPGPDALRRLAYHENVTKKPVAALATLEELFVISPYDELGRIERARSLRALERYDEALDLLDDLVRARPGDDVSLMLRSLIRGAKGNREGSLADLIEALKGAPLDAARRYGSLTHRSLATFEPAVLRAAERIGKTDLARATAILEGIGTGEADYYRAVLFAAHGSKDEAMRALGSSIATGFVTRERLLADPRLEPLRGRADFPALPRGR